MQRKKLPKNIFFQTKSSAKKKRERDERYSELFIRDFIYSTKARSTLVCIRISFQKYTQDKMSEWNKTKAPGKILKYFRTHKCHINVLRACVRLRLYGARSIGIQLAHIHTHTHISYADSMPYTMSLNWFFILDGKDLLFSFLCKTFDWFAEHSQCAMLSLLCDMNRERKRLNWWRHFWFKCGIHLNAFTPHWKSSKAQFRIFFFVGESNARCQVNPVV